MYTSTGGKSHWSLSRTRCSCRSYKELSGELILFTSVSGSSLYPGVSRRYLYFQDWLPSDVHLRYGGGGVT